MPPATGKKGQSSGGNQKKGSIETKVQVDEIISEDDVYDSADDDDELVSGSDEGEGESGDDAEDADEEEEESGVSADDEGEEDDEDDNEFEQQSSDDEEDDYADSDVDSEDEIAENATLEKSTRALESKARSFANENKNSFRSRVEELKDDLESGRARTQQLLHTDDLSSDDEEADGNTIGRVPLHWYDAFDHIGYDISGQKLMKRLGKDRLDMALANRDDPLAKRTVYDMYNDREVVLSDRDMEIIRRIQAGAYAHQEFNDTPDYVDYFSSKREIMPLSAAPEAKHSFLPSKWEMMKVTKIMKAMKEGRYKPKYQVPDKEGRKPPLFMIWNDQEDEVLAESRRFKFHLPAPKMPLPGHAESYNPPEEYLLTEQEQKAMEALDPKDRPYNFIPKKNSCLRHVSGYQNFVKERFERCLDLYLCPRKLKARLNIDPETLVPRLPKPSELRPYPNSLCMQYLGHKKHVRSISLSPDGQYLVSGSDDGTVRLWEVDTGLCRHVWQLSAKGVEPTPITTVQWNPNGAHHLVAVALGSQVVLIATGTGDADSTEITETLLAEAEEQAKARATKGPETADGEEEEEEGEQEEEEKEVDDDEEEKVGSQTPRSKKIVATWHLFSGASQPQKGSKKKASDNEEITEIGRYGALVGPRVVLKVLGGSTITQIVWHHKGDYLATVVPTAGSRSVAIHQLSKGKTQCPFTRSPGQVQHVCFHPSRPFLFVATQQHVKVYHLVEQKLVKKLLTGCKWISFVDVHHSGDHLIVGSYDRRVVWFDLDLSSTPYKTLKFHEKAVRCVQYHKRYPLMASASDDGTVHIFHSTVYSDLTRNPLIVPLKVLHGHGVIGGLGVLSIAFHPRQPWIFTSGADGVINLFQDL